MIVGVGVEVRVVSSVQRIVRVLLYIGIIMVDIGGQIVIFSVLMSNIGIMIREISGIVMRLVNFLING